MLSKIDKAIPLKVFITSRPSTDLERLLAPLPKYIEQVTVEDTLEDIRLYIETYSENLPVTDDPTRRTLIEKIVEKSSGSFLWTVLVMRQLDDIYSLQETEAVLEEVPEEMEPLYMRNLELMSTKSKTTRLAKTVLTWAVCAQRAINIAELKHAIKLDINDVVARDLERSISSLCGQLVVVDKRSRVQLVHQTARTFLTNPLLQSEFRIGAAEGHLQLALACLKYLTSDEMKFVRKQRRSVPGLTGDAPKRSALADYACLYFAEHIARASSASDTLFRAITLFLQTNVLSWIERIAETRDLSPLLRTAKHFKAYLARRAKHVAPLQDDIRLWATDLPRIATEFGRNLLSLPSSIHLLIPPLCPRKSIIHRQFANKTVGIRLQGLASSDWMDRIFCTYYRDKTAKVVVCRDQWFAAGLSDGSIVIYNTSTCAEVLTLSQNESIRMLQFGTVAKTLASAGGRFVKLWDVSSGSQRAQIQLNSDALAMFFDEKESTLTIATRSKEISQWSVSDGKLIWSRSWTNAMQDSDIYMIGKVPTIVEISTEHKLMAIVYRSLPVIIWDLEGHRQLGTCTKKGGALEDTSYQVTSVLFNPNPDINLIAIAYWDGDIALFDTYYMAMKSSAQADAQILAASPDGRTLATGNSSGKIQLFDFETLHLLYSVSSSEESITAITFTSDNLRFLDVRGSQLNVWEPSVLVRNYIDDDRSEPSEGIAPLAGDTDVSVSKQTNAITSIVCCFVGSSAICGKTNGQVELYNLTSTDKTSRVLYKHKGSFMEISTLDWNEDQRVVASVDNSSRFQVVRLSRDADGKSAAECILLNDQLGFGDNVQQLLLCPGAMRLLVSTAQVDLLWSLQTKKMIARHQRDKISPWKWLNHPLSPSKIVLLMGNSIQFYSWESLEQVSRLVEIRLVTDYDDNFDVENTFFIPHTSKVVFKPLHKKQQSTPTGSLRSIRGLQLYAVDLSVLDSDVPVVIPSPFFSTHRISDLVDLDVVIGTVVGVFGGDLLVFISKQGWVCSIDLNVPLPVGSLQRHFFVPFAWLSASAKVLAQATARRDIVFVHGDEVAVVQNGLDDVEIIDLS
jgi:WD40 repeat protein